MSLILISKYVWPIMLCYVMVKLYDLASIKHMTLQYLFVVFPIKQIGIRKAVISVWDGKKVIGICDFGFIACPSNNKYLSRVSQNNI